MSPAACVMPVAPLRRSREAVPPGSSHAAGGWRLGPSMARRWLVSERTVLTRVEHLCCVGVELLQREVDGVGKVLFLVLVTGEDLDELRSGVTGSLTGAPRRPSPTTSGSARAAATN